MGFFDDVGNFFKHDVGNFFTDTIPDAASATWGAIKGGIGGVDLGSVGTSVGGLIDQGKGIVGELGGDIGNVGGLFNQAWDSIFPNFGLWLLVGGGLLIFLMTRPTTTKLIGAGVGGAVGGPMGARVGAGLAG